MESVNVPVEKDYEKEAEAEEEAPIRRLDSSRSRRLLERKRKRIICNEYISK